MCVGLASGQNLPAGSPAFSPRAVIDQYCVTCHNQKLKTAGLTLDKVDLAHVAQNAEVWEKVVRKLRAGMMPPPGLPRPDAGDLSRRSPSRSKTNSIAPPRQAEAAARPASIG